MMLFWFGMWIGGSAGCVVGILGMAFLIGARDETDAEMERRWWRESHERACSKAFRDA